MIMIKINNNHIHHHLHLSPNLNDAAIVGDQLLGRNREGCVSNVHRLVIDTMQWIIHYLLF